jgi:hypothetical protein
LLAKGVFEGAINVEAKIGRVALDVEKLGLELSARVEQEPRGGVPGNFVADERERVADRELRFAVYPGKRAAVFSRAGKYVVAGAEVEISPG